MLRIGSKGFSIIAGFGNFLTLLCATISLWRDSIGLVVQEVFGRMPTLETQQGS